MLCRLMCGSDLWPVMYGVPVLASSITASFHPPSSLLPPGVQQLYSPRTTHQQQRSTITTSHPLHRFPHSATSVAIHVALVVCSHRAILHCSLFRAFTALLLIICSRSVCVPSLPRHVATRCAADVDSALLAQTRVHNKLEEASFPKALSFVTPLLCRSFTFHINTVSAFLASASCAKCDWPVRHSHRILLAPSFTVLLCLAQSRYHSSAPAWLSIFLLFCIVRHSSLPCVYRARCCNCLPPLRARPHSQR